eukprot:TRINITY_DN46405_c0_g1_i1.p1 TRINITY_DN46405_c0_g1~~TRINITY_DN46405_c0_g1_i1.p1  ORF type:complete len:496 (+),score=64.31 TRINITY_DN46405_c0_g1_i1:122-1609(+)
MPLVQMITCDKVGGANVPVEVEATCMEPLRTNAKNLVSAAAKKFKTVTKQSRVYHGTTGLELIGNVELDCLNGAYVVFSGKGGWKGAAQIAAAHANTKGAQDVTSENTCAIDKVEPTPPQVVAPETAAQKKEPSPQNSDWRSSLPESSESDEEEPCIVLVYNTLVFADWAGALRRYLKTKFGLRVRSLQINVKNLSLFQRLELENSTNIIIPVGREVSQFVASIECNACVCDADMYHNFDHKGLMTSLEFPDTISQIPTHVVPATMKSEAGEIANLRSAASKFGTVIVKPAEEAGSKGQRILSPEALEEMLAASPGGALPSALKDTIIQPYFKDHSTIEFNFFAREGEVIEWLCTYSGGGLTEDMWANGTSLQTYDGEHLDKMVAFVRDSVRLHQLQGLLEFEFLISEGKVFFLEVNPRISSSVTGFDSQGCSPYIEKVVVPCLQHFGLLKGKELADWEAPSVYCPPEGRAEEYYYKTYVRKSPHKIDERNPCKK